MTGSVWSLAIFATAGLQPAQSADQAASVAVKPATEKAQAAMEKGLAWFQAHQKESGAWSVRTSLP